MSIAVQQTVQLPFVHLNLRHNPFGELTEAERVSLSIVCVQDVVALLNDPQQVVQYVGEKGHGKTTHLLKIREALPGCRYLHIPEGERRSVPAGDLILIDEAQRLTWWQRRTVFRQRRALVMGTHRDFESELRRAGRVVTTIPACRETSLSRLRQIVDGRIEFSRRGPGPVPFVSDQTLRSLLQTHPGDIRSMLNILYHSLQNMTGPQQLE